MNRRGLLVGLLAAPVIVRPGTLMPVSVERPCWQLSYLAVSSVLGTVDLQRRFVRSPGYVGFEFFPKWETMDPLFACGKTYLALAMHRKGAPILKALAPWEARALGVAQA